MSLEPIDPETALDLYLADRETEVSEATLQSHRSRLGHFVRWCDKQKIDNLNDLTGRQLHKYRLWRREDGNLAPVTEKTQMDTLRVFIRWLATIDGVDPDLHKKIISPTVTPEENTRHEMLESEVAEGVIAYLEKYAYASLPHVTIAVMWHTAMRVGALAALDVDDYHRDEQCLELVHRPETDTPIKNKHRGERYVAIDEPTCTLIDDWLATKRPSVMDAHGRKPLLATQQGRAHVSTLRTCVYRYSRPCIYGDSCPHDRDPENCTATEYHHASKCPSSVSPHAVRRGSITQALNSDVPVTAITDRTNVSQEVLSQHYDERSEREKMEQRREFIDEF